MSFMPIDILMLYCPVISYSKVMACIFGTRWDMPSQARRLQSPMSSFASFVRPVKHRLSVVE